MIAKVTVPVSWSGRAHEAHLIVPGRRVTFKNGRIGNTIDMQMSSMTFYDDYKVHKGTVFTFDYYPDQGRLR